LGLQLRWTLHWITNWTNTEEAILFYTPSDASEIGNCSLFLNNALNQTRYDILNNIQNNFSINNVEDGVYLWYVNCTDNSTNKILENLHKLGQ